MQQSKILSLKSHSVLIHPSPNTETLYTIPHLPHFFTELSNFCDFEVLGERLQMFF
jgi:hypothetical protein